MATIAKGMITLSSVNDAFTVSLSPNSCVISAQWDGSTPDYSNAYADLTVYMGETSISFDIIKVETVNIEEYTVIDLSNNIKRVKITKITDGTLSGKIALQIKCSEGFTTWAYFPFSVMRETGLLDWILDWEGREKTEIAGEHIITPKIFVGKSENGGQLTGTYIGPAFDGSDKVGVFGYSSGKEIFHLDNTGGMIGGWHIENGGIQTSDGVLKILSEGTIISAPSGVMSWQLNKDGTAIFAGGDVTLAKNLSVFKGEIQAAKGKIGGWTIGSDSLHNSAILISSSDKYIGVRNASVELTGEPSKAMFINAIKTYGGLSIYYENANSFGIEGWSPSSATSAEKVFSLGSSNIIGGWHFDNHSLWSGEDSPSGEYAKVNTEGRFTSIKNAITIGDKGIRGNYWRLESDGSGALANGQIWWDDAGYCEFKGTLKAATIIGSSISGGTIQAVDYIKSENGSWQLNNDGSGKLAGGNVNWKTNGHVNISGGLRADTFELAICQTMENGYIDGSSGSFISPDSGSTATLILPALSLHCARIFHLMIPSDNEVFRIGFEDENVSWSIPGEERLDPDNGFSANESRFDEDGFASVVGLAGDWFELIGIKTYKSTIEAMLHADLTPVTASHIWLNGQMKPLTESASRAVESASMSDEAYHTHWFLLPKSSRMHWFMMSAMGLTL